MCQWMEGVPKYLPRSIVIVIPAILGISIATSVSTPVEINVGLKEANF